MLTLVPPSSFGSSCSPAGTDQRKHENRVADLELRVHDRAVWSGHAAALLGAERALVEVDRGRRIVDGEIRHEGAVTLGDRLRHVPTSCSWVRLAD